MFSDCLTVPVNEETILQTWRNTLLGTSDRISEKNEDAWRTALRRICEQLAEDGRVGRAKVIGFAVGLRHEEWVGWMRANIESLWNEQITVAEAVLNSIHEGVEF